MRMQRRSERLRNLWRLLVFTSIAGGLAYGLLRQGWILNGPAQVEVVGSQQVDAAQVIRAADLHFPQPLLGLQPKQIASAIAAALPVEQVQVTRLMAPPRLRVTVVDREAVARAERQSARGLEQGYVDRLGNWMSTRQGQGSKGPSPEQLQVRGWQARLRPALAMMLERRQSLGADLQEIRFEPGGSLWLKSASLGEVRLGPIDGQLNRRLEVLQQLGQQLPAKVKGRKVISIDLSDPEQPELGLPAAAGTGTASGPNKPVASRD
ncbi:FtsQ-type POTRA domain-containing protein [Cyanobium sp. WAJ14-Wanaka]|nr:FtsQ-type POTRA domain-containing protein [Cyanobium sp. WAJ14-Wanaka]